MSLSGLHDRRQTASSCTALSTLVVCFLALGWLPQLGLADTYDIGVYLFKDANCLFFADEFLLLDNGCYANIWAPNSTKAYKMNIVFFNSPQRIDMREYTDSCHTLAMPKRTLTTGTDRCNAFHGSTYAQFDIRFRSNTCKGQLCSNLAIAVQTFYSASFCAGPAYSIFRYPVQGECLRAMNGTQNLLASSDDSNITLKDFGGSDKCDTKARDVRLQMFSITNKQCYPLYSTQAPRSFGWRVERNVPYAAASDAPRSRPGMSAFAVLLIAGIALFPTCHSEAKHW